MDFFRIREELNPKNGSIELHPDFIVGRSRDLMIRAQSFYAIWDDELGLWSTDEYDVQRLVDAAISRRAKDLEASGKVVKAKYLNSFSTNGWAQFRRFMKNVSDNAHQLDETITFANTVTKKSDYVSKRLSYSLEPEGDHSAWDELTLALYSDEERAKIEWAIGAVLSGDAKKIQKFLVFYGSAGTGKSTILNVLQRLFEGYYVSFEAKALAGNNNTFATEVFRTNPLVAIQHDGDLSKIEDNTRINSIVSHEEMTMHEKYKPSYSARVVAFLFMGTNKPVKISDAKSGLIRRLIDVHPTGNRIPIDRYNVLMSRIDFELGAIAAHCLKIYRSMGKSYYNAYRPTEMMFQTDIFFNFVEAHYDIFGSQDGVSLKQAYALYKTYCSETGVEFVLPQYKVREELRSYFSEFLERASVGDAVVRSYYRGFVSERFKNHVVVGGNPVGLVFEENHSLLDLEFASQPAQEANESGTPRTRWALVETKLSDIDTSKLHYVKPPENLVVIDFDIKDENGAKSLARNLAAAAGWPPTYGELSQSQQGVHLHYYYDGEPGELATAYRDGIEIKSFGGNASLRRRFCKSNGLPIANLTKGSLPLKEKKVLSSNTIQTEKGLRDLINRNLRKEIHPGTKPSIDFIRLILEEAYSSGMQYDVTDMRSKIAAFANNSTNQALICLKTVQTMRFKSAASASVEKATDERLAFFDVEVYSNLFVVCWKYAGDADVVRMINPTSQEIEKMFNLKLVGFNNRRYDNHILWARFMGYNNQQLFELSQKIIAGNVGSMFGEAYNISYTDIYDFSSKKQGLKKFQIELGIHHAEMDIPWDQPVKDEDIARVVEYCVNDVVSTEVVFKAREQDFVARQILAELSGLTVNDTTQKHTSQIVFGNDPHPQREFIYTDLSKEFPGYVYEKGKSTYRGVEVGEGGYVYAEPGMYQNVAVLDVASMHPTSIEVLNAFGPYTRNFSELKQARLAIKRQDYDLAKSLLDGKLGKYLGTDESSEALAYALKIVINIVYGLTSAKFDNKFRDVRNKDNIVAKRGALFMIDLLHFIREQGYEVVHIKTDSVKIPNATQEIIDAVFKFGEKYGYEFEYNPKKDHYDQFCLVNDAVYIARIDECLSPHWTAVGAQFQHPYVMKKLFTHEDITFDDLCEARSVVQGHMFLEGEGHSLFVGRTGLFVPVINGGGRLVRIKDGKSYAVTGTKGYMWELADYARTMDPANIDMSYFESLAEEARKTIDYYGPFSTFVG